MMFVQYEAMPMLQAIAWRYGVLVRYVALIDYGYAVKVGLRNDWGSMMVEVPCRPVGRDTLTHLIERTRRACVAMREKLLYDGYSAGAAYEESLSLWEDFTDLEENDRG